MDKDNTGVVTGRLRGHHRDRLPDRHRHRDALRQGVRGLPDPVHRAACRATTSTKIPVADQVNGAGFRPDEIAKMPVSGPFKYESVTPQAELRLARNELLPEPAHRQAGQPRLRRVQVVRRSGRDDRGLPEQRDRRRLRPPGLGPAEGPGPRRPGLGDPGPPVRVPAPELVAGPVHDGRPEQEHRWLLAQPGGPGPRHGLPDGRPGDPPGHRLRDRQERDQHAAPRRQRRGREHEHQPVGVVLRGPPPVRPSTRTRPSRSSPMAAGPTPTATASSRRTASRPRSSCARRPGRSARTRWPSSAHGSRTSASTASSTRCRRRTSSPTTTRRPTTPRATSSRSNFDVAEHASARSIDPLGNYSSYHSSQFRPTGANDAQVSDPDVDKSLDDVKNNVDFQVVKDAMATFQEALRRQDGRDPAVLPQERRARQPALGNYFANGTQAGSDLERRGLVRHAVGSELCTDLVAIDGAPGHPGAPSTPPAGTVAVGVLSAHTFRATGPPRADAHPARLLRVEAERR